MKSFLLAGLPLSMLLTQCVDPMMYGPGGPGGSPYGDPNRQIERREQGTDLNRLAYERGLQDGQMDAQQRQAQNPYRHSTRFDRSTEMAYRDGYNQAYSQAGGSPGAYGVPAPGPGYTPPQQSSPATRDPVYNQGYDYGLRDLTSGRVDDAAAHVGRYDPRHRSSFERGYQDGYHSRSGQGGGSGAGQWFR